MIPIQRLVVSVLVSTGLVAPLYGADVSCDSSGIQVNADNPADANKVCEAVQAAHAVFQECRLPDATSELRIDVVDELKQGCVALYHCGENWIEILSPEAMQGQRLQESAFAFLEIENYFRSVVVHELSHAVFDKFPCPFESCVAAGEYIAYSLQVMSLTPEQQKTFETRAGLDRKISRDELNAMYLFLAPNKFAQKAWTHLNQRKDPCDYLDQVIDGTVLFDREHL